jgi:hypothetical protein
MSSRLSFPRPPLMIMKFIVEVDFPLEPFSTYVRKGTAGEKIGEVLGAIKPEVITSPTAAWDAAR